MRMARGYRTWASLLLASAALGCHGALAATVDEVVVTGTRGSGYAETKSPAPVSVYDAARLAASGYTDVGRAIEAIAPSINLSHSQTSPSAANTRSITMKGLSPDQVLVLVNGKRWQTSAVLVFNNAVGRGSAPYDLGAIPMSAVARIEVLSDSDAAQYGSDAIAGVVNIILKSNAAGGVDAVQAGLTDRGDGANYTVSASQGFAIGATGHLTLTGELRHQDITNRAVPDPRNGGRIDQQEGDPRALDIGVAADADYPLIASWDLYGSVIASRRDSVSAPTFRLPGSSVLYPSGFLPQVNPLIWNVTAIGGVKGDVGHGVKLDISNSFGYDRARFKVYDTANDALGAASPTQFNSGALEYWQDTANLTLSRDLADLIMPGNLAGGLEYRAEHYAIAPGEPLSSQQGGAQGFPGFAPRIPVDNRRDAASGFLDLELDPIKALQLGAAGRYDHYSDFGDALTWKATARFAVTDWLAVRGAVGTGFRAPSLQQQYFSSVVSQITTAGALTRTGTYQVRDPIAVALGATPLKAETSRNYTVGFVVHPSPSFRLMADWYDVDVSNRIVLSNTLSGPAVSSVLVTHGVTDVQQVAFFTNAAHTDTQGYEVSADYAHALDHDTSLETTLQYGRYHTTLLHLATNPVLPTLPLIGGPTAAGRTTQGLLVSAQPLDKITSSATLTHGPIAGSVEVDHYGSWVSAPLGATQTFGGKTVADVSLRYAFTRQLSVTAGVLNVADVYPDLVKGGSAIGLAYGDEAPFGVNGRAYFVRLQVSN